MNLKLRQNAIALTEELVRTYYCVRDIDAVLDHMAPDATWIGPGDREKLYTLKDIRTYFEAGRDAIPSCEVSDPDLRAVDLGEDICLVTGSLTIRTPSESNLILEMNQRLSFTFRFTDNILQVVHMHISNPYGEMKSDEFFPHEVSSQSYEYLQRILHEKTEVINMITGNITGGLKGSNDDSTFSFFYVNEGLPEMLGFTYDEFMEKTGGTAVGAVYPPDLSAALEDCARCFAEGYVYSTEYRMEKKDGSLIWVLDTGRKALDGEGIMRINSIITDITPLKQALLDLEIERERYRIALENITGSMCEYDIAKDLFTIYRQSKSDGIKSITKREFPHFSKTIYTSSQIHPEDRESFLDLCTGRRSGPMDFRTCFFRKSDNWCWDQFNCSMISDSTGIPVRSIGILKDITDEKLNNMKLIDQAQRDGLTRLLNQTAVKDAIQEYLAESHEQKCPGSALLMLDLDHFKEINDSYGHLYGNEVLMKTARILENTSGSSAIVGRAGGDEFVALIKGQKPEAVALLADEIVRQINEISDDIASSISCSVGIACHTCGTESFSQFFDRADKALYCAKNKGRNQWAMDDGNSPAD